MSKNPFLVLGISEDASKAEVDSAYIRLRDKYRLDMHQVGDRGKTAAKQLSEVEDAYREISSLFEEKISYDGNIYNVIEQLIKKGKLDEAQSTLDEVSERGAEWHYFQSAIYYKKSWLMEAQSQLKLAMNMDPKNEKYANSYNKLESKLNERAQASGTRTPGANQRSGYHRSYQDPVYRDESSDTCCACCQGLMCANCLCDCMRCCG